MIWRPSVAVQPKPSLPNLEVVLVNAFSEQAPLAPQLIAQENLEGGGDQSQRMASNPSPRVGEAAEDLSLVELSQQRQQREAQQAQLLKQLERRISLRVWPTSLTRSCATRAQMACFLALSFFTMTTNPPPVFVPIWSRIWLRGAC